MKVASPKTSNMLNIFDPITFPIAISVSPFFIATIEVTNSGNDVPIATIDKPTKFALIPNKVAMEVAESTTISPPITIPKIPITLKITVFNIGVCVVVSLSAKAISLSDELSKFVADLAILTVEYKKYTKTINNINPSILLIYLLIPNTKSKPLTINKKGVSFFIVFFCTGSLDISEETQELQEY